MSINAWRISLYTEPRKPETEAENIHWITSTVRTVDGNILCVFAVLWIQIRMHSHHLKVGSGSVSTSKWWAGSRSASGSASVIKWTRIRINLKMMAHQNVPNMSLFEHFSRFWAFMWKLGSESGLAMSNQRSFKIGSFRFAAFVPKKIECKRF